MAADGEIIIDTSINTDGLKVGSKEIEQSLRRSAKNIRKATQEQKAEVQGLVDEFNNANRAAAEQEKEMARVNKEREKLNKAPSSNKPMNLLQGQYEKAQKQYQKLLATQQKFLDMKPVESNKTMLAIENQMTKLEAKYDKLIAQKRELEKTLVNPELMDKGQQERVLAESESYQKLEEQIYEVAMAMDALNARYQKESTDLQDKRAREAQAIQEKLDAAAAAQERLNAAYEREKTAYNAELEAQKAAADERVRQETERKAEAQREATEAYERTQAAIRATVEAMRQEEIALKQSEIATRGVHNAAKKVSGFFGKMAASISIVVKRLRSMNKETTKARFGMKRMLIQSLLFSTVFRIYSNLVTGMGEGINNLVLYSDSFNNSISTLMSSMTQLKNAWATAFQPIIEFVTPALEQLISYLVEALTWISHFASALTGKTTYTAAKKVQQDYRESIEETTEALEDQEKVLYSFDTIERATNPKKASGTDDKKNELKPEDMFETHEVETGMQNFAEKVKDTFGKLFDPLKEAWDQKGGKVLDSAKFALREIMELAKSVGASFIQVWNDEGYGERITANVLEGVSNLLDAVGYLAHNFREAWNEGARGTSIMRGLLTIVETISNIFLRSTEIIKDWALNLDFSPLLQAVDEVLPYINDSVERVGEVILWLLEEVIAPVATALIEDLIPRLINLFGGILDVANALYDALSPLFEEIFNNFLQPMLSFAWDTLINSLDAIVNALHGFSNWIRQNSTSVQNITKLLVAFFAAWEVTKLLAFIQQSGGVITGFKNIASAINEATLKKIADKAETVALTALYAVDFVKGLASATVEVGKHAAELVALAAKQVLVAGKQQLLTAATKAWNTLCTLGRNATALLTNAFTMLGNALQTPLGKFTLIATAVSGLIALAATLAKNWSAMTPTEKMISGLLAAAAAAAAVAVAVGAITGAAGAALVAGAIVAGIASANIAINAGKRAASAASGSGSRGYSARMASIPNAGMYLPRLASGTVVPPTAGEFAAILGDNKREAEVVSPLSTMKQALKEALAEVGGVSGSRDIHIDMIVDGKKFASAVYKANNQETQRVGVRMVTSG